MKITRGECLLLVAIVTSAVVAEVREHTLPATQAVTAAQTQGARHDYRGPASSCYEAQNGMLRAACGERPAVDSGESATNRSPDRAINRADRAPVGKMWV